MSYEDEYTDKENQEFLFCLLCCFPVGLLYLLLLFSAWVEDRIENRKKRKEDLK